MRDTALKCQVKHSDIFGQWINTKLPGGIKAIRTHATTHVNKSFNQNSVSILTLDISQISLTKYDDLLNWQKLSCYIKLSSYIVYNIVIYIKTLNLKAL